ncbi:MAG: peptidylprolyl isomerase [Sphingomicrobium sp.]
MLRSFRRLSKSKVGTALTAFVLIAILAGIAMSDIRSFGSGDIGFGMGSSSLARVGNQTVTQTDMSDSMQRRLADVRQQKPDADYKTIAGDFDTILASLVDQRTLIAFADQFGFKLSKRLIDAEITQIPQTKGLNGEFSDQAYQQFLARQRLTDVQVRQLIAGGLLQRLLLTPVATNARASVGMAMPYASMLLESREGEAAVVPLATFRAGLTPTDTQLQAYYSANRGRYVIPEQRVLRMARIGPDVPGVATSDAEIAAYYQANQAIYAAKQSRTISQAVVPDQAAANAIAARAKAGASLTAAAGAGAAVTTSADQTRAAYADAAGDKVAAAVFAAPAGAVVGPLQSEFGWVVAKVDAAREQGGKTLAQARAEIAGKLLVDKRKAALEDLVNQVQTAVDDGSNFAEAANAAKVASTTTPLIAANGRSRADPAYKLPADYAKIVQAGFESAPNDPPEIVALPKDAGYVMVAPAEVVAAAPAPLAAIRARVANDWTDTEASRRARAAASAIAAKVNRGAPLAQAVREAGVALPPVRPLAARRLQIATAQGTVPAAMRELFSLAQGKSRMIPDAEGRGFFIVKVLKIVPGNAALQPSLISQMQTELQSTIADDYARQFVTAVRAEMKARTNEAAIKAEKVRLAGQTS